jgi:hypothetical protein
MADLVRVAASAPIAAEHDRQVEAVLSAAGTISGKFSETHRGSELSNAVSEYHSTPHGEFVKGIDRSVSYSISGETSRGIEVHEGKGEFVLQGSFTSDRFVQRPQANMILFRAGLLRQGDYRFAEKTRKYPVVIDADALRETVRIELPKEFRMDELPDALHLRSDFG